MPNDAPPLPDTIDGLPNIAGREAEVRKAIAEGRKSEVFRGEGGIDFSRVRSAAAIALHMHQPLIPAGGDDLAHRRDHRQPAAHDGEPGHRR